MHTTITAPAEILFLGSRARVLADAEATGGTLGLVEMLEMPAGDRPPLHVHHTHDEGFYVLEGQITMFLPGREIRLSAGDWILAPRGVPHAYEVGDAPARALVMSTPAGFEAFVTEVAALDEVDPERLTAVAAAHDIEILGPPGARPAA